MRKNRKRRIGFVQFGLALLAIFAVGSFALVNTVSNIFATGVNSFSVNGLTADYSNGTWSAPSANALNGSATGTAKSGCDDASSTTSTMTLTCSKNNATLSFDYAKPSIATGGYVKIDNTSVTVAGSFEKQMNSGDKITIVILSGNAGAVTSSVNISNINLVAVATIAGTFLAPNPTEGGTYTINGTDYSSFSPNPYTYTTGGDTTVVVKAIPSGDYNFGGWFNGDGTIYSTNIETEILKDTDYSIYPYFYKKTEGLFYIDGVYKNTFSSALSYAQSNNKKIICVESSNAFIPAGNYEIPSGYTLLVPYEATRKNNTTTPNYASSGANINASSQFAVFRKLTLMNGAHISLKGSICVNGYLNSFNNYYNGVTYTTYGYMYLSEGSSILVQNTGKVYCYGYISGEGEIDTVSGATLYEPFQINDYRGGTQTYNMKDHYSKVFPFTQYFVQNIEAKLRINYGAFLYAVAIIKPTGSSSASHSNINFIGPSSSSSKFLMTMDSGCSITKKYHPDTDRNVFDLYGDASIAPISLTVYVSINSKDYVIPLMQNMTFNVHSGTLNLSQSVCLIPGCQLNIDEGATIISSANVYVYDRDEWVGHYYVFTNQFSATTDKCLSVALFSPTRTKKMTHADMLDAEINVNGTLIFGSGGSFYTTSGGANIHSSSGEGKIKFEGSSISGTTDTYQWVNNSGPEAITVTSAKLKNMDGTYTSTSGTSAGEFYNIHKKTGIWTKGYEPSYFDIKIYDEDNETLVYSEEDFLSGDDFIFPEVSDTSLADASSFKFWTDGTNIYAPGDTIPELIGVDGSTTVFRAFRGGWFGLKYYRYDIGGTDPVKGFWTIGDNSIRDYKKLSDDAEQIPYHSTCYFDMTTGELDTGGTTYESGSSILFMPEKIVLNTVDNNYYLILGGILERNRGLFEHINGSYYYFGDANFAYKDGTFYVSNTNGLSFDDEPIQPGYYYFDSYGIMDIQGLHTETKVAPTTISGGVAYVTYDTEVADNYGLFAYNNNLYYAGANGLLVTSTTFYVSSDMINGCTIGGVAVEEGLYYFDSSGRMYDSHLNLITNGGQTI